MGNLTIRWNDGRAPVFFRANEINEYADEYQFEAMDLLDFGQLPMFDERGEVCGWICAPGGEA